MIRNQRPLLLTGMFRSGTTLFAYMLNANKNINLVSDPFAPFFKSFRNFYAKKIFKKFDTNIIYNADLKKKKLV